MTAKRKTPRCANTFGAHSEATGRVTSTVNMSKRKDSVKTLMPGDNLAPITTDELMKLYERLEKVYVNLDAVGKVFGLIADQSTEFDVVQPLASAGALLTTNVADAMTGILLRLGRLSGQLVLEGVA